MADTPTIPDGDSQVWFLAPANRLIHFILDQQQLKGTLYRALSVLSHLEPVVALARQYTIEHHGPMESFDLLLAEQRFVGPRAQAIAESEFHPIHVSTLVALWSAIEVAVEDTAVLLLLKEPATLKRIESAGVSISKQLTAAPTEQSARRAVSQVERTVRRDFDAGPALVEALSLCGMRPLLPDDTLTVLSELNQVRNCILHRGGLADQALLVRTSRLSLTVGDPIVLTSALMDRYIRAINDFAVALTGAVAQWLRDNPQHQGRDA